MTPPGKDGIPAYSIHGRPHDLRDGGRDGPPIAPGMGSHHPWPELPHHSWAEPPCHPWTEPPH
uniref:Uncharacterized protein n=1 Tax=Calidris pygmaea TaxID=425635 RepID=A0A8C3JD83_9CHAR